MLSLKTSERPTLDAILKKAEDIKSSFIDGDSGVVGRPLDQFEAEFK